MRNERKPLEEDSRRFVILMGYVDQFFRGEISQEALIHYIGQCHDSYLDDFPKVDLENSEDLH